MNEREVKSEHVKTERRTYTPEEDNVRVVDPCPRKQMLKSSVARTLCICDGLEHNSLVETLP